MVPMGERAGLTIILINGGHTGSGLKGTPVGSRSPRGERHSGGRIGRKEFHPFVRHSGGRIGRKEFHPFVVLDKEVSASLDLDCLWPSACVLLRGGVDLKFMGSRWPVCGRGRFIRPGQSGSSRPRRCSPRSTRRGRYRSRTCHGGRIRSCCSQQPASRRRRRDQDTFPKAVTTSWT